jgi:ribose transport system permease protein
MATKKMESTEGKSTARAAGFSRGIASLFERREAGILIGLVILLVLFSVLSPTFFTARNLLNITRQVSIMGILSLGMTLAILIGGIDLSVGSVVAFVGVLTSDMMVSAALPPSVAVVIGIATGLLIGLCNGLLIGILRVPAFIATLGTMTVFRGATYIYTKGAPVYNLPGSFGIIGAGYVGTIPIPTLLLVLVAVCLSVMLNRSTFGRSIYAIGGNQDAARYSGIPVKKRVIATFGIVGALTAISGLVLASRLKSGLPTAGTGYELTAIAAVILGGASINGGSGSVSGTFMGVLLLGVLENGLNLLNVDPYILQVITGLVIIFAVVIEKVKPSGSRG